MMFRKLLSDDVNYGCLNVLNHSQIVLFAHVPIDSSDTLTQEVSFIS
jgi:hypothetical protein